MGGQGLVLVQMSDPESKSELEGEGGAVQMCQPRICPGLSVALAETAGWKEEAQIYGAPLCQPNRLFMSHPDAGHGVPGPDVLAYLL